MGPDIILVGMRKNVQRTVHKGREILVADFANRDEESSLAVWDDLKQALLKETGGVLVLIDARNTQMSLAILNKARDVAGTLKSIPGTRVAFVGMTSLQKSAAQVHATAIHLNAHYASTVEEAREWLVAASQNPHSKGLGGGPGDK